MDGLGLLLAFKDVKLEQLTWLLSCFAFGFNGLLAMWLCLEEPNWALPFPQKPPLG